MKTSILSATLPFAIFLNAAVTFAGQWTEVPGGAAPHPSALNGVAAVSANDIWAVGSWGQGGAHALIEHWNGTNWSVAAVQSEGTILLGVAARVWAIGSEFNQPLSARWDGTQWRVVPTPPVNILGWLSAISGRDGAIWTVGAQGGPDTTDLIFNWTR